MLFWVKTAFIFLIRSGRSTFALFAMLIASVSTLIFLSAMAVGINDIMVKNSVNLFSGHIQATNLPASIKKQDLMADGVTGVLKRVYLPGILTRSGRVKTAVIVGVEPDEEERLSALKKKITEGRYPLAHEKAALIGKELAEALNAKPGDTVEFRKNIGEKPAALTIAGIYRVSTGRLNELVIAPADAVTGATESWQAAVFLDDGVEPGRIIENYKEKLPGAEFKAWTELMPDLKELIDMNYVSMTIVMALVFGLVSVCIAAAFSIFILKNLREYGIMRSMGVTDAEVSGFILIKICLMNVVASIAGVLIGSAAVFIASVHGIDLGAFTAHNQYFTITSVIIPRLTPYSLALSPAASIVFGAVAAIWPALLATRRKTAEILRELA